MSNEHKVFHNIFHEKQIQAKKRLDDFLMESGEKQIHRLRVSIRRLEALYFIYPNSCKRKKIDNFVTTYKLLFKKSSSIRDMDVIIKKLSKNGLPEDSKIIKKMAKQKNKKLRKIIKCAKKISELKYYYLKNIANAKITQKRDRVIFSLITKIQDFIPVVISDESKIKELHSMRKTTKKLRYILEIDTDSSYEHFVEHMKSFQTLLGSIHDCEITINFIKKHLKNESELMSILSKEEETRSKIYYQLVSSLSNKKSPPNA